MILRSTHKSLVSLIVFASSLIACDKDSKTKTVDNPQTVENLKLAQAAESDRLEKLQSYATELASELQGGTQPQPPTSEGKGTDVTAG